MLQESSFSNCPDGKEHSFTSFGKGEVCNNCGTLIVKSGAFTDDEIKQIQIEAKKPSVGKLSDELIDSGFGFYNLNSQDEL